eukprot:scaffold92183_cov77-Cyclotella_meneghiniana.AAC.2
MEGPVGDPKHVVSGPGYVRTMYSAGTGLVMGTFYGACQAAWFPDTGGTSKFHTISRTMLRPAMWAAITAGAFTATQCSMEAARNETQDHWNSLVAGAVGGGVIGMTTGKPNIVIATAIGMGLFMTAVDLSGAKTVYDEDYLDHKRNGLLPKQHKESDTLAALKELYPKFKDL